MVFTKLHAGGKFGGGTYNATGGLHGVGSSVVNALSSRLDVEVDRSPATQGMSFRRGAPGVFDGDGPTGEVHRAVRAAQGQAGRQDQDRHPGPVLAGPADLHQGRAVRAREPGHPGPAHLVPRPRPGARDPRRARQGARRGAVQARRRDHGVLRVPRPGRAGDRGHPAPGPRGVHRDRSAARRQGPHDAAGRRARPRGRRGTALGDGLRHRGPVLRQRDRDTQGRHPRRRLRRRRDQDLQRRAARVEDPQGRRGGRHQGRRARGPDRGRDRAAGRAAVRGPDQGGARHTRPRARSCARSSPPSSRSS